FEQIAAHAEGRMGTRARVLLGRALLALPDREKPAERALQQAVKDDPDHVEAHYLLGTLYRRRGLPTRATAMFRRALPPAPPRRPRDSPPPPPRSLRHWSPHPPPPPGPPPPRRSSRNR